MTTRNQTVPLPALATVKNPLSGVLLTLMLSALTGLTALAIDMSLPAMPQLQKAFGADVAQVQLTLSLFLMGYGVGQFVSGPLSDHYGRRPILLAGILLFTITSFLCATSTSLSMLLGLRLLQGIGASVGPILARAMVRDLFKHHEAVGVLSSMTQVMVLAPILAPIIGGYLLVFFGWPVIFVVLGLAGIVVGLTSWRRLPETLVHRSESANLLKGSMSNYGKVFAHRPSLRYIIGTCFSFAGLFSYVSGAPFVIMDVFGVPQKHFGFYFALPALSLMAGASANRVLLRRLDSPALLRLGATIVLVAGVAAGTMSWLGLGGLAGVIAPIMLYLFGLGIFGPNATVAALAHHGRMAGAASSLMGGLQTVAGAVSGALVGAFYDRTPHSLAFTLAICAVLTFVFCGWKKHEAVPAQAEG